MKKTFVATIAMIVSLSIVENALAIFTVESGFFVTETYTDNLFFSDEQKEDDFGTYLGPILNMKFENPDIIIGAEYRGTVQLWVNNSQANTYSQNSNITLDLPFLEKRYRGLSVQVIENFSFTPQLDAFSLSLADENNTGAIDTQASQNSDDPGTQGAFTSRANVFQNLAGLRLGYDWTARLTSTLSYQNQYTHFFSTGFQDSMTHTGSGSANYQLTNEANVGVSYSFSQTDYKKNTLRTRGQIDRSRTHRATLSLFYQFSPSLTGSLSGGPAITTMNGTAVVFEDPDTGEVTIERVTNEKLVTALINAALTKTYQQGQVGLSYVQNIGNGGGLLNQPLESKTVTSRWSHSLSRRLGSFISFAWAKSKSLSGGSLNTTSYRIQAGLNQNFASWLTGNFSYSYINQNSDGAAARDAIVNQFFLGLTANAPPWRLWD